MISHWAPHVDHELSQLIKLHYHMRALWYPLYSDTVRRACRVAYASHLRALLEFFHNGRPAQGRLEAAGCELRAPDQDITYQELTAGVASRPGWTNPELLRLCDADKLVGHLSKLRGARTKLENLGSDTDIDLWRGHATALLSLVKEDLLPKSHGAAKCHGL